MVSLSIERLGSSGICHGLIEIGSSALESVTSSRNKREAAEVSMLALVVDSACFDSFFDSESFKDDEPFGASAEISEFRFLIWSSIFSRCFCKRAILHRPQ